MSLPDIVARLAPSDEQLSPVISDGCDIAVTAGAGTGKTRTLVGRYLRLLAAQVPLRGIIAITFTRKAAREMRGRVREAVRRYLDTTPPDALYWERVYQDLDAARIGTIHSLCGEILRRHPAEAGVDPAFLQMEEGALALERARAITAALAWAADDPAASALFDSYTDRSLRRLLESALNRRLELGSLEPPTSEEAWARWRAAIAGYLSRALSAAAIASPLAALGDVRDSGLLAEGLAAGDKLAPLIQQVLACSERLQQCLRCEEIERLPETMRSLGAALRGGNAGRAAVWGDSGAKEAYAALRKASGDLVGLAGKDDCTWMDATLAGEVLPAFWLLYRQALGHYRGALSQLNALDYDDLEERTLALLLAHPHVLEEWRETVQAILVDEFQDTNGRQRDLVQALNGDRGRLFIVGDGKQSIYGFRGADVTVFREEHARIDRSGQAHVLKVTYRAHPDLVSAHGAMLAPLLGAQPDPERPYVEPYAHARSGRPGPAVGNAPPYVEVILGAGTGQSGAPGLAARALVNRLIEIAGSGIRIERTDPDTGERSERALDYGDIAILCRASRSFSEYEDALEAADIPYLTVSGRGFYGRPEVRDLLNALQAISDPLDDLALAGLLRSPAFGIDDMTLALLRHRQRGSGAASLWQEVGSILQDLDPTVTGAGEPVFADPEARARLLRARNVVSRLADLAGRCSVADLLKAYLDATHYRAILLAQSQHRALSNVDKLLADAAASGLTSPGELVDYVAAVRDASSREGEARGLARGAVQLMSIHQAKGLEFPVVVLGDANSDPRGTQSLQVHPELGLVLPPPDLAGAGLTEDAAPAKARSLAYAIAAQWQNDREAAESDRLLYVALTRAEERLLITGHARCSTSGKLTLAGMLARLDAVLGLKDRLTLSDPDSPEPEQRTWSIPGPSGDDVRISGVVYGLGCELSPMRSGLGAPAGDASLPDQSLLEPLDAAREELPGEPESLDPPRRVWHVVPARERPRARAWVVGQVVHRALSLWSFPDIDPAFARWAADEVRDCGVTSAAEERDALTRARRLLRHFAGSPLYAEMDSATTRLGEIPFSIEDGRGGVDSGIIDALYRDAAGWVLVEFKTDHVQSEEQLEHLLTRPRDGYLAQVARYLAACDRLLPRAPADSPVRPLLCFLDCPDGVRTIADRWNSPIS